jgi:hypothetical protein
MWLLYALVRLLAEKKSIIFHDDNGTYLFFENSVYSRIPGVTPVIPRTDHHIICLINADRMKQESDISFMTSARGVFPIMATPPNPERFKTIEKDLQAAVTEYMPLWTRDELKDG